MEGVLEFIEKNGTTPESASERLVLGRLELFL